MHNAFMLSLDPPSTPKYNAIPKSQMKVGEVNVPKHVSAFYRFNDKKGFIQTVTQTSDMSMPA